MPVNGGAPSPARCICWVALPIHEFRQQEGRLANTRLAGSRFRSPCFVQQTKVLNFQFLSMTKSWQWKIPVYGPVLVVEVVFATVCVDEEAYPETAEGISRHRP